MIKQVPGEKRKWSLFSTFQSLVKSSYSITALLLKLPHRLRKKNGGPKFFRLKVIFLSGLIGKFHINFTVDNVFEILVSRKKVQLSFQWFILFKPSVNHLVSIKKGHKKASRAFLLMIYNVIIDFLFCK